MKLLPLLLLVQATSLVAAADLPPLTDALADCENRWVLLEAKDPSVRVLAFVYVDPSMGVTIELNGQVKFSETGALARIPSELEGKARVISRVTDNYQATCLSDLQVAALGLSPKPEMLDWYKDNREPGPHFVAWALHFNAINAPEVALKHLQAASDIGFSSYKHDYEKGFALNALGRYDEALKVLEPSVNENPNNLALVAELAFAYVHVGDLGRGIETYNDALALDRKLDTGRRAEFAQNLGVAYARSGDDKKAEKWFKKAREWGLKP